MTLRAIQNLTSHGGRFHLTCHTKVAHLGMWRPSATIRLPKQCCTTISLVSSTSLVPLPILFPSLHYKLKSKPLGGFCFYPCPLQYCLSNLSTFFLGLTQILLRNLITKFTYLGLHLLSFDFLAKVSMITLYSFAAICESQYIETHKTFKTCKFLWRMHKVFLQMTLTTLWFCP